MTVVVGVDGTTGADRALAWAASEAARRGDRLRVVHAWTYAIGGHAAVAETHELLAVASQRLLDRAVARAHTLVPASVAVDSLLARRPAALALTEAAEPGDLLVVGAGEHGALASVLLGSVADACLRHAHTPVALIRPDNAGASGPVVVGVDGSPASTHALEFAVDAARRRHVPVHVLHAWQPPWSTELAGTVGTAAERAIADGAAELLGDAVAAVRHQTGVVVVPRLVRGPAAASLLDEAATASLLVLAARGAGGFRGLLLGSVTSRVVHASPCPVVVHRA